MRRRSRSEVPPHTPWSMPLRRAYSRQGPLTGHSAHTRRATSTPTPSLGKNREGGSVRHLALSIHISLIGLPLRGRPLSGGAVLVGSCAPPLRFGARSWTPPWVLPS